MSHQLDFMQLSAGFSAEKRLDPKQYDDAEDTVLRFAAAIAERHEQVVLAKVMRKKPAALSQALRPDRAQRNGHSLHLRDVIVLICQEGGEDILAFLMALRDEQLSEAEILSANDEVLSELLPGVAQAFRTKRRERALMRRMQLRTVKGGR